MENKQYHLVSRNNYFLGKLMTARDFFTEQEYFNARRRLGNRFTFGTGIIAGMNLFLVDDKTFSLEPGFAVDFYGREIIVAQPCVRKLNLVRGFEKFKNKSIVYLCIKYCETLDESTFSVTSSSNSENEKQFNRIKETFDLFITDQEPQELNLKVDGLIFQKVSIFQSNGIKIWGIFPKYVIPNAKTKIDIFFEKDKVGDPVYFEFKMSGILFKNTADVTFEETEISDYKSTSQEYYLECNASHDAISEIIISKSDFELKIGNDILTLDDDIKINISVKNGEISDILISEYYSMNFDNIVEDNDDKYIYLAKIRLLSDNTSYIIDKFEKNPANQYVLNNEILHLIQQINNQNSSNEFIHLAEPTTVEEKTDDLEQQNTNIENLREKDNVISGVETINFGFKPKPGKVYYSYEFVHGLGKGNISVTTAIVNDENPEFEEENLIVFGDRSIFGVEEANLSVPDVQIATLVDPDKGTMRIGVRLEERTSAQMIKIRWWAMKPVESTETRDNLIIDDSLKIVVSPDNVTVKPLEQVRFSAKIIGTDDQRISWGLGKNNPGKIDANGLYTAPATEGIFEIIAKSVNFESIYAVAYAVVTTEPVNDN